MLIQQDSGDHSVHIKRFEDGCLHINDTTYQQPLVVTPNAVYTDWLTETFLQLDAKSLEKVVALEPDVILAGTVIFRIVSFDDCNRIL